MQFTGTSGAVLRRGDTVTLILHEAGTIRAGGHTLSADGAAQQSF